MAQSGDQILPHGRRLSDLWLDGKEGHLHPAEHRLLQCARTGEWCRISESRPAQPSSDNLIRAEVLRFLALGGDRFNPLHDRGLQIEGAFVECALGLLDFNGTSIVENLVLMRCTIAGNIVLRDALAESIYLDGCQVEAMDAERLEATGSVFLRDDFISTGLVRLAGAKIGGGFECDGGAFVCAEDALDFDGATFAGSVLLSNGFKARGSVKLHGVTIGGDLDCNNGQFLNAPTSLSANRIGVAAGVFLSRGFLAEGKVSMEECRIGAGLNCRGGSFNAADQSLSLKFSAINGNADFGPSKGKESDEQRSSCSFEGGVSLQSAKVEGDVIFTETRFNATGNVNLRNARIEGQLYWRQISGARDDQTDQDVEDGNTAAEQSHTISELNLAGATCLTLNMDWDSWQVPDRVRLDHFTYNGFSELPSDWNAKRWKDWLERQPDHHLTSRFRPHPYQQLAMVLDGSGYEEEARVIRIERREKQRLFARLHEPRPDGLWARAMRSLANFWRWIQKIFIGHGYRPGVAVIWLLGLIFVGGGVYQFAARDGIMAPTHPLIFKEAKNGFIPQGCAENWVYYPRELRSQCLKAIPSEYSEFQALVYSFDVAIPVVNFRMEDDWSPRVVTTSGDRYWPGWWVRSWEWFQIGAGWALSLLFVSAIGGVIRRD